jgi:hypothetical protein
MNRQQRARRRGIMMGVCVLTASAGLALALGTCWRDYDYDYYSDYHYSSPGQRAACGIGWAAFGSSVAFHGASTIALSVTSLRQARWLQRHGVRVSRWRAWAALILEFMPYTQPLASILAGRQARVNRRALDEWRTSSAWRPAP